MNEKKFCKNEMPSKIETITFPKFESFNIVNKLGLMDAIEEKMRLRVSERLKKMKKNLENNEKQNVLEHNKHEPKHRIKQNTNFQNLNFDAFSKPSTEDTRKKAKKFRLPTMEISKNLKALNKAANITKIKLISNNVSKNLPDLVISEVFLNRSLSIPILNMNNLNSRENELSVIENIVLTDVTEKKDTLTNQGIELINDELTQEKLNCEMKNIENIKPAKKCFRHDRWYINSLDIISSIDESFITYHKYYNSHVVEKGKQFKDLVVLEANIDEENKNS